MVIVVMGVTGAGKSTLGSALARRLGWDFIEGDDHHPPANIEKMRSGQPLNDADRRPWLVRLHQLIAAYAAQRQNAVLACSALKKDYRAQLSRGQLDLRFVYLAGDASLIHARLKARAHHFMLPQLLDSQIAALEPPHDALLVPINLPTDEQVGLVRAALAI